MSKNAKSEYSKVRIRKFSFGLARPIIDQRDGRRIVATFTDEGELDRVLALLDAGAIAEATLGAANATAGRKAAA